MNKLSYLALLVCMVSVAKGQTCNLNIVRTTPDSRYELVVGSGGSEVLDKQTGLIWQRCSLGQSWNGTVCTGTASIHTWTDALAKAKEVGNGYRLPNIKELSSLAEKACVGSAINNSYFPNTASIGYWSSSPDAGSNNYNYVWNVEFHYGSSHYNTKNYEGVVRVVRVAQ